MTRLNNIFYKTKAERRAALITFIMAGDPNAATSLEILNALPAAGADIIEIGMPFSDPMADGPTIQAAGLRALDHGMNIKKILDMVKSFREKNSTTPIVLMGYYNPVYRYGSQFSEDAASAGVDGVILVDLPPEEEGEFAPHAKKMGLDFIRLIAPTSLDTRLSMLTASASGFIYYISVAGITGAKAANADELKAQVAKIKAATPLPVAVGFGIKTPAQVKEVAAFADAVVVGSALVEVIAKSKTPAKDAAAFVQELADGLKG